MGKLIKNHWARLIVLTGAVVQIVAAIEGCIWPKVFWDFSTEALDILVKPVPILQIINMVLGVTVLSYEWPLGFIAGSTIHRNILPRLLFYPLCSLWAILMYQSINAGICYLIATGIYSWAYFAGEVVCADPWALPADRSSYDLESAKPYSSTII